VLGVAGSSDRGIPMFENGQKHAFHDARSRIQSHCGQPVSGRKTCARPPLYDIVSVTDTMRGSDATTSVPECEWSS